MKKTIKIYLAWYLGLLFISFLATRLIPFTPSFPYHDAILANLSSHQFIWHWANFDGVHYITIAEKGYIGTGLIQAFFPLYAFVIRWVNTVINNLLYSGLLVSNFCFILGLYFFQKLLKLEGFKDTKLPLLFLLLFPTSFYFAALYSESLFFLLAVLSFIYINKKRWAWAAVFAGLASATRLVGIFIAPALLWEFYQANKKNKKISLSVKGGLLGLLSLSGFLLFSWYLNKHFDNPFYFAQVQNSFGASRQTDRIILFYQVVWRYLKMLFTVNRRDILFYTISQEFFLSIFVLGVLVWAWIKKFKRSYLFFALGSFFLPPLTGNLSSMPRYVSLIIPLYFYLARIKSKRLQNIILFIFSLLLVINTALFLRGFWVG